MKVKELFENETETGKIKFSQETQDRIGNVEFLIKKSTEDETKKELVFKFVSLMGAIQEECYVQGFKAGVQLMSDSLSTFNNE